MASVPELTSLHLLSFKNQFAHTYYRRWYENNGRFIYRRCFRYSLDAFIVSQVVAVALLWVLKFFKLGGACIPLVRLNLLAFISLHPLYSATTLLRHHAPDVVRRDLTLGAVHRFPSPPLSNSSARGGSTSS